MPGRCCHRAAARARSQARAVIRNVFTGCKMTSRLARQALNMHGVECRGDMSTGCELGGKPPHQAVSMPV